MATEEETRAELTAIATAPDYLRRSAEAIDAGILGFPDRPGDGLGEEPRRVVGVHSPVCSTASRPRVDLVHVDHNRPPVGATALQCLARHAATQRRRARIRCRTNVAAAARSMKNHKER
jgi:hypothetical protein